MATQLDDDILQRYYDGELTPAEERKVRAQVEDDAAARARLAELARLSDLLRRASTELASELDSEAMFAGIEAELVHQQRLGFGQRLRVITTEWSEHKKAVLIPLMATTAVAAAALVMFAIPGPTSAPPPLAQGPAPSAGNAAKPPAPAVTEPRPPSPAPRQGSEVEAVEFGTSTGTVFKIDSQGVTTAVVWIADEEEESAP